ncbi:serine/threonine-protein kinase [Parafrankia discariae]|uniref:serine/threonine-protein kinase n=1 Tax=Parafrankia discariae TaxID=365528 RepID=UPI0003A84FA2|nr:serine/threonine-protein kinase [Parafrankia discariae]
MVLLREGQVIRDTYKVDRLLGEGAFAEVYRVEHRYLGRQAMKVFRQVGMSAEQVRDALGEAMLLSGMGHPNVIRVFEANTVETAGGTYAYFTMEYVAGGTLHSFWSSYGTTFVPVPTAVDILRQMTRGLAVAHRASPPIVHRDITPQNILVGYSGAGLHVRISDFGLARKVSALTLLASSQGTIAFMAPETLLHPHLASVPGDVWALGAVLYLLLTDQLPYPRRSGGDPITAGWNTGTLVPPSEIRYSVDEALDGIVGRALSYDPAKRYPSAVGMLADLEAWEPGRPAPPRPPEREPGPAGEIAAGKNALGRSSSADEATAVRMARQAVTVATGGQYDRAADLMEEACNKWPGLRNQYASRIRLWRKGVTM